MKCYNCGGEVLVGEGAHIGICSCCMAEIPLPEKQSSILEDYSTANELLSESRFEEAKEAFRKILIQAPLEAAAYWGIAVSEYGIEFVQDPATGEHLPTLHRLSTQKFSEHLYVTKAIQYALSLETREFYQNQSKRIDEIQSHSLKISAKEDPYDVFICYKKTEEGEKRTADSRMAADLYRELKKRGYKVFFAEETLQLGEEYEPRIFAALHSAKVLLAIASQPQYYEAVWVKNEWSRYADLIRIETEAGGTERLLIPVYQNMERDALPEILRQMPSYINMKKSVDPRGDLLHLIGQHFERGRKEEIFGLQRQLKMTSKFAEQLEDTAGNYLIRATVQLIGGAYETARELFQKSIDMEETAEGYLGLCMCELQVPGKEALYQYYKNIRLNKNFLMAKELADDQLRQEYEQIAKACDKNAKRELACVKMRKECEDKVTRTLEKVAVSATLGTAHEKFESLKAYRKRVLQEVEKEKKANMGRAGLWRFFLIGNVIPAFTFMLRAKLNVSGANVDLAWSSRLISNAFFIVMFLVYNTMLPDALDKLDFMSGARRFRRILINIVWFFAYLYGISYNTTFFYGVLCLFLLYHFLFSHMSVIRGFKIKQRRKKIKKCLTQLEEKSKSTHYSNLEDGMIAEAMNSIQAFVETYRDYYWKEGELEETVKRWRQCVEDKVVGEVKTEINNLENILYGGDK